MNPKDALYPLLTEVIKTGSLRSNAEGATAEHLGEMILKIAMDEVTGEKAHRWLGYIQGCLVQSESCTLDEVKEMNKPKEKPVPQ